MTHPFFQRLEQELNNRREQNLLRSLSLPESHSTDLTSNDYFQLRRHPEVVKGAMEAALKYGAGTGASPLLGGFRECHEKLAGRLSKWTGKQHTLIFNTGFTANQAILNHLPGKNDLVLIDRLAHHSLIHPLFSGNKRFHRYRHNDMDHLQELLVRNQKQADTIFVVTESIFSMDGDATDLSRLVDLKRQFQFLLILDEAHALGTYGPTGAGLAEELGLLSEVDLLMGTLGKSLASMGAFLVTDHTEVVPYLINQAGEFIYSTYLAPACAGAATTAIGIIKKVDEERKSLRSQARNFRIKLQDLGFETCGDDSPIVPLILGSPEHVLNLQGYLKEQGIGTAAVRPPTVPDNTSRIRFSLHSKIQPETLEEILTHITQWQQK